MKWSHGKRILSALTIITPCLILLLMAGSILLSRHLNQASFKERLAREICHTAHCEISYESLRIALWPTPRVTTGPGTFQLSPNIHLTWIDILVVPKMRSLLSGKVEAARIVFYQPALEAVLESPMEAALPASSLDAPPMGIRKIPEKVLEALAPVSQKIEASILDGSINIEANGAPTYRFTNIRARLRASPAQYDLQWECRSNLAEKISIAGQIKPDSLDFQLTGLIVKGKPHLLGNHFSTGPIGELVGSSLSSEWHLNGKGLDTLEGWVKASSPQLKFSKKGRELSIEGIELAGQFSLTPEQKWFTLSHLHLRSPGSTFQGSFTWNKTIPESTLHIRGRRMDAAPIREAALFIWESQPVVKKIFEIVLAGNVPLITFDSKADHPGRLGGTDHFVLEGEMHDGTVLVPNARLLVKESYGKVTVKKGILECKELHGITAGSTGKDGYLVITLKEGPEPFHFHMDLDADLAEVVPVLERVVRHEVFLKELALFKDVQGRGKGKLILGESLEQVETTLELSSYRLSSHYERLFAPFTVQGKRFLLKGPSLFMDMESAAVGNSSLDHVTAQISWDGETRLALSVNGPSSINLDEFYPWLLTHETVKNHMKQFQAFGGRLALNKLQFQGPALQPQKWEFNIEGKVAPFAMECSFLPSVLSADHGAFKADHDNLQVMDAQSRLLDAEVTMSGIFHDYTRGLPGIELRIAGNMGPEANRFVMDLAQLPTELRVTGPYTVERCRLKWTHEAHVDFDGDFSWKKDNGVSMSLQFEKTGEALDIRRLSITDAHSRATASILVEGPRVEVDFSGTLHHTTLDRILVKNELLEGTIDGAALARLHLDAPMKSTFRGHLSIEEFKGMWGYREDSMQIQKAALEAEESLIHVTEAKILRHDNLLDVRGGMALVHPHMEVDLHIEAESIDWDSVPPSHPDRDPKAYLDQHLKVGDAAIVGRVHLKTGKFQKDSITLSPFEADIEIEPDDIHIHWKESGFCGLSTTGTLFLFQENPYLQLNVLAENADLAHTIECLQEEENLVTGKFNLRGHMEKAVPGEKLTDSLTGQLDFEATNGRLNRLTLLGRIFSVINITEFYRGHFPDWRKEGLAYNTMEGKLHVDGETVRVDEFVLDGPYMKIVVRGIMNLTEKKMNMTFVLSPLRTADRIIDMLPIVGGIMGGSLILIPVKVEGDMDNPTIIPLSPDAVGSEILGYLKRIFQVPLRLIQPGS